MIRCEHAGHDSTAIASPLDHRNRVSTRSSHSGCFIADRENSRRHAVARNQIEEAVVQDTQPRTIRQSFGKLAKPWMTPCFTRQQILQDSRALAAFLCSAKLRRCDS